jgi:hypothetical protein
MFGRTAQARVFTELYNKIVDEYLREFSYMASMASLHFEMSLYHDNL